MSTEARPREVCYIEDNPGDVRLMVEAIAEANPCCRLRVFPSMVPAIQAIVEDQSVKPDLILVDGGLCNEDSSQLLKLMRMNPALAGTPVIMFSGSPRPQTARHELWDRWVQKPSDLESYFDVVRDLLSRLP